MMGWGIQKTDQGHDTCKHSKHVGDVLVQERRGQKGWETQAKVQSWDWTSEEGLPGRCIECEWVFREHHQV